MDALKKLGTIKEVDIMGNGKNSLMFSPSDKECLNEALKIADLYYNPALKMYAFYSK